MDQNLNLNKLMNEQEGYLMKNFINGVEVTCTEKFVEHWKKRGFEIVKNGEVRLMPDREDHPEINLTFTDQAVKLVKIVAERNISNTQSIKTLIVEKDGKRLIALQKWWRESSEMPWREGKGFYFNARDASRAVDDLSLAVTHLTEGK
ncbi:hypothetical protein [Paenibacillus sp. ATY16]|uniref:hypothetical protein n=1 Tax=Paenibacillus sp. ATY16 TaxID=1759312 RepID=UPI000E2FC70D|nr:hypothetical protein [Paenibacillus sp. ATY16]MCK9857596.1 hypothetical protein [Paenibacillus sp. ATY16]